MTDLQNKSDWLAEHLLGWRREYYKIYAVSFWERQDDKGFWSWHADGFIDKPIDPDLYTDSEGNLYEPLAPRAVWQPHEKIEQCFAHILPAMIERNLRPVIFYQEGMWKVCFRTVLLSSSPVAIWGNPAAAIVEAAYAALQKEKE